MGKRLQRLSGQSIIEKQSQLLNTELHLVLKNGSTFHGIIHGWIKSGCNFKDFRNHPHYFLISEIEEIITDNLSSY
jgi:hypothetical protein